MKDQKDQKKKETKIPYLPLGMSMGISIGVAIGAAMDNIPIAMCIGLSIGMCLGASLDSLNRKDEESKDKKEETE